MLAYNGLIKRFNSIDFSWTFSDGFICLISSASETLRLKELFLNPLPIILKLLVWKCLKYLSELYLKICNFWCITLWSIILSEIRRPLSPIELSEQLFSGQVAK